LSLALTGNLPFIDNVQAVNVESVRELAASGVMLTSDENVVRVEMNVQYRVTDPERYLFSVTSADDSLRQATDSALRGVIGKYTMDRILTEGRTVIRSDTQRELEETIRPYNMGITLLDVNFQTARPPEEVKAAFDDAIAARENEQQYIREAEAYTNEVQPRANGQAQRILEEARAYKTQTVLEAQGEVARFAKILPEYKAAPEITRERLYIETMEKVLSHTRKVLVNDKGQPDGSASGPDAERRRPRRQRAIAVARAICCVCRLHPAQAVPAPRRPPRTAPLWTNAALTRSVTTTSVRGNNDA
jgi:membrane protease subunit HflK